MPVRKILITGGLGYVGSRLTPHLLSLGHDVRVLDALLYTSDGQESLQRHPAFTKWKARFEVVAGDLRNPKVVEQATQDRDVVIHLAAISNDPTGEIDEVLTRQVNFEAVGMLLAIARGNGVKRFINASSSSVFGIKDVPDVTEQLEPEPLTSYAKYKMLSEWLVTAAASSDFCAVNIRPASICGYSPRQRFDLTVNKLTADAVRKRVITVYGGQQRRPNVGMADMINLYGMLIDLPSDLINGRTFNFGFENHKVIEIAQIIQRELAELNVEINVTSSTDHRDYHISSAKIQSTLQYKPVSSIRQEVAQLRTALESGEFPEIEDPIYYNMKSMALARNPSSYKFFSR